MEPVIKITSDGSQTIYLPELDEHYHSIHGALTESMHVFIHTGLEAVLSENKNYISVLEIGLGTGLNALLTLLHMKADKRRVHYTALEPHPLSPEITDIISFENILNSSDVQHWYTAIHKAGSGIKINLTDSFIFIKHHTGLENMNFSETYDLIYFDAFSPKVQPDIWRTENFEKLFKATNSNGILVTYCAQGAVRRSMQHAGYIIERLPGPPHKREMLRAKRKA